MVKEGPILFSTRLVNAILRDDNPKTQTRRIINPQPNSEIAKIESIGQTAFTQVGYIAFRGWNKDSRYAENWAKKKYEIGQHLWVRETWKISLWDDEGFGIQYKDGKKIWYKEPCDDAQAEKYASQCADDCDKAGCKTDGEGNYIIGWEVPTRWRPSIFMPRWASRIQLEIVNLKVERLQDITEEDAFAEGVQIDAIQKEGKVHPLIQLTGKYLPLNYGDPIKARSYFAAIWDSLNEKRGYSWEKNPFVWVIEFRRIK